jgi:NADH-quinone oxidoreductase subunit H
MIVPVLLAVAFFSVYERHILAALQRRQGPNTVGFYGIFQALADGLKLLIKESIVPKSSNTIIFFFAPIFTLGLALIGWSVIPVGEGAFLADFNLGVLFVFAISSLSVHSVIMAGWSSNSKYAFLGGLRSAAQMISYEVSFGAVILSVLLVTGTLNFSNIVESQKNIWLWGPLLPVFILFFISALAETNRHPFDLPEAEAELVSGYNVEYSAMGFALFFLGECSNLILMSTVTAILFLGGWHSFFDFAPFTWIPGTINCALKTIFFITLFVLVRGALPRYRYDQLMRLGWKVFLPIALALVLVYASILISFNATVEFVR